MQKDADSRAGGWALAVLLAVGVMTWMVTAVTVFWALPSCKDALFILRFL